jgi:hypothetical protein
VTPVIRASFSGIFVILLLIPAVDVWAYRPFVSTDAAVADPAAFEIELGYLNWAREKTEQKFFVPNIVVNYGVIDDVELVGELAVEEPRHDSALVIDPALSVKAVLKDGVLQEKNGVSAAIEAGLLLPSGRKDENRVGFQGIGILSGKIAELTYHLNLGGGTDREKSNPFVIWGIIAEFPVAETLRAVGEINGESGQATPADNSALLGCIWTTPLPNVTLDAGIRRGISHAANDWALTTGFTFSFSLPSANHNRES